MSLSRAQRRELNLVNEGLAIGCLSLGLQSVRPDEQLLIKALRQSWERWPHAHKFPALTRGTLRLAEVLCEEMVRQNRRIRSADQAFWRRSADGAWLHPVKAHPNPQVGEALQGQASTSMHWDGLAASFIKYMGEAAVVRPAVGLPPG
jgi:hypothetical protein